jgi:hypothetical protein
MAEDANDNGRDDETMQVPMPDGKLYATDFDADLDEEIGTLARKQKILTKIMCVSGKKTYVAEWMKQMYEIILEADPEAMIETPSGLKIDKLTDFPSGKKFQTAFIPVQSDDTKQITMNFQLTTAPALNKIKTKHRRLVEHLPKHKIYLEESFSGSDEEVLIGYFLCIQANKLYLTGFADDLHEILAQTQLQQGEHKLMETARTKLPWTGEKPPPFYIKVRNITRHIQGEEFSSKAVGIIVAKEHATFYRMLFIRTCDDKLLPGLGEYYNLISNDRTFPRIIKWHNEQLAKTTALPVTREAMIRPLKAQRGSPANTATSIRSEISRSGLFNAVHSTRQTFDEGRWILIIKNKNSTEAATKLFDTLMKALYASDKPKIPANERIEKTPVPAVEPRDTAYARTTDSIRSHQANAWGTLLTNINKITGGSQMRNMQRSTQRNIVEISFDTESEDQFPNLTSKQKSKTNPKPSSKHKHKNDEALPTSSQGESTISAVTRAEFENLSQGISQTVRDEVQSTVSNSTDQTMITLFRDEMAATAMRWLQID